MPSSPIDTRAQRTSFVVARGPSPATFTRTKHAISPVPVGAVMIAVRQGLVGEDDARKAWTLWPLILVGVGLSIVLAGRPGAAIGGIVLALTFGAMLGGIAATGTFPGAGLCSSGGRDPGTAFAPSRGGFDSR